LVAVVASFSSAPLLFSEDALASSVLTSCPSAASIQSAAGESLTRIESSADKGTVVCVYTGKKQSSFAISVAPLSGLSKAVIGEIESQVKSQLASDHGIGFKTVSGIGAGAVEYTQNKGARTGNGYPGVVLAVFTSRAEITIDSDLPQKNILALAHKLI
jgi:hypothetical protein